MDKPKKDERIHITLTKAELQALEDWRWSHRMSRAEAVRHAIRQMIEGDDDQTDDPGDDGGRRPARQPGRR